jgi:hypothetical protein
MENEVACMARSNAALRYALGFLGFALVEAIKFHFLRPFAWPLAAAGQSLFRQGAGPMPVKNQLLNRPQRVAAICAIAATGLGLVYMTLAGAPLRYLALNAGALAIGFAAVGAATALAQGPRLNLRAIAPALSVILLLTSLFGARVEGAARWVAVGGLFIQSSLLFLPVITVHFARHRDRWSMFAIVLAAIAMAIQPDRAMSGALTAAMVTLALVRRERIVLVAMGAALTGFVVTLIRPDVLPAMPFVDQILYSSFDVHLFAGLAVLGGAAIMIVPAIVGALCDADHREAYAAFGAVWLAIIIAAALGNYPTPVVGYGGSAIIGYVICLLALPKSATARSVGDPDRAAESAPTRQHDSLFLAA